MFEGVSKILAEGMLHGHPQPDIVEGDSVVGDFINKPLMLGLDPLVDVWALEVGEKQQAMLVRVLHSCVGEVNTNE